jgi:hypothetical protein
MTVLLALRNIVNRPLRSLLLLFGYSIGVAVMIVLLSVGEALLSQARQERLVGGGEITVLPQGIDVEVMKTSGVGGLFFSIDHSRFIYRQLLASPRLESAVSAVAPQIDGRLLYLRTTSGTERPVRAAGDIPSRMRAVGAGPELAAGEWVDDDGDRKWITPSAAELRHEIDHFHLPPDTLADRDSWAEWHYFNVLSADQKRWAFISFIVAGDVTGDSWGGNVTITLREQNARERRFVTYVARDRTRFSTSSADVKLGESTVTVTPDGDYRVHAIASGQNGAGRVTADLVVHPAPGAYFPGASLSDAGFVSGYTVPGLRADATGTICVNGSCEQLSGAQSYHDHNWGVWRGVTWDWGASRAGSYTLLYGRVIAPERRVGTAPLVVYLVDSLGFRAVFRPRDISYDDSRSVVVEGRPVSVPSRATFVDIRGADTLGVDLEIEDAIGTDTRAQSGKVFIQMKGRATIRGRIGGEVVGGTGSGFFETYR